MLSVNAKFEEAVNFNDNIAALMIKEVFLPKIGNFDPCARIWHHVRKYYQKPINGGVDVVGLFLYDEEKQVVSCSFCLNWANIEDAAEKAYQAKFENLFQRMLTDFEEDIDAFLQDQDYGHEAYCKLFNDHKQEIKTATDSEERNKIDHNYYLSAKEILNNFVRSIG